MFDVGWSELLLIGIVALIVVGPKDLPRMFNALGRITAKAKSMGREFQRAMDDAAKQSGVAETARDFRDMTSKKNLGLDKIEEAARKFEKWDPMKDPRTKPAAGSETAKLAEKRAAEAEARKVAAAAKVEAAPEAPVPEAAAPEAPAPKPRRRSAPRKPKAGET